MVFLSTVGEVLPGEVLLLADEEPYPVSTTCRDTSILRGVWSGNLGGDTLMIVESLLCIIIVDGSLTLSGDMNSSVTDGVSRRGEPNV